MPFHSLNLQLLRLPQSDSQLSVFSLISLRKSNNFHQNSHPPTHIFFHPNEIDETSTSPLISAPLQCEQVHGFLPTQGQESSILFSPIDCSHSHLPFSYHFFYLFSFTEIYSETVFHAHCSKFFSLH